MTKGIKIAVGVGLVIGISIIITQQTLKKQGYSRNKFLADTFNVPFLDKKYQDLQEQTENLATKDKIEFR